MGTESGPVDGSDIPRVCQLFFFESLKPELALEPRLKWDVGVVALALLLLLLVPENERDEEGKFKAFAFSCSAEEPKG